MQPLRPLLLGSFLALTLAAHAQDGGTEPPEVTAIRESVPRLRTKLEEMRGAKFTSDVAVNRREPATPAAAHASNPRSSVAGPHTQTSAPAAVSDQTPNPRTI